MKQLQKAESGMSIFFNIYHPNACIITSFSPSEVETVAGESGKFKRLVNLQSLYSVTLKRFETNKSDPNVVT